MKVEIDRLKEISNLQLQEAVEAEKTKVVEKILKLRQEEIEKEVQKARLIINKQATKQIEMAKKEARQKILIAR